MPSAEYGSGAVSAGLEPSLSLDHVGFMAAELDRAAPRWERLGFTLSPRSPQTGYDRTTGKVQAWATANQCAMLRRGYLELIGVVDPALPNPWAHFLARGDGIHIAAFRCADADVAWAALARRAPALDPPLDRRRQAPYGKGTREMRFRNIFSRDEAWPEGRFIVIEHQTPEVIWQETLMRHPNGAVALDEVVFCDPGAVGTRERLAALLGVTAREEAPGWSLYDLPSGGRASVMTAAAWSDRFPQLAVPARPGAAAVVIGTADPQAARRIIAAGGVSAAETPGGWLLVGPGDANGAALAFAPA